MEPNKRSKKETDDRAMYFMQKSIAPSTQKVYDRHWSDWAQHCEKTGAIAMPGDEQTLIRFLTNRADEKRSAGCVKQDVAAIKKRHTLFGMPSPTDSERVSMLLTGIEREYGKPAKQAEPMTTEMLGKLMEFHLAPNENRSHATLLRVWRTLVRLRLCLAGIMRFSDVMALRRKHLKFDKTPAGEEFLRITIPKGKTDQTKKGQDRIIPSNEDKSVCAVTLIKNYMSALKQDPDCPIQQGIVIVDKKTGIAKLSGANITRSTADKDRIWLMKEAGMDPEGYTEHSGRVGGAVAIYDAGGSKDDVKRAGNWASDACAERYVQKAYKRSLTVAKHI